jgi:D-alanyl-D-alanine carboxypeptidase
MASDLSRILERAASDEMTPSVIAAVYAPGQDVNWTGAVPGAGRFSQVTAHPDQPFRIASVTKIYVAAAVLRLVEDGQLDLQDPMARRLGPETLSMLGVAGYDPAAITLSHLLSHTSGLLDHAQTATYGDDIAANPYRRWTRREQIAMALAAGAPLAPPGTVFRYSDTGYVIIGEILERVTGETLGASVRRLLAFESLGLTQTYWETLEPAPAGASSRARQYMMDWDATDIDPSFDLYGGGGLISTVSEMARFVRALVHGHLFEKPGTLPAGLLTPRVLRQPESFLHANLCMSFPMGERMGWGHSGFWGCVAVCCPDRDLTVAATINQARPARADLLQTIVGELAARVLASS